MGHKKRHAGNKETVTSGSTGKAVVSGAGRGRILSIIGILLGAVTLIGLFIWGRGGGTIETAWVSGVAKGYNIVLITMDTTRADHIGCYGRERAETPIIDRLAREGIRFEDAVSPVPMTLPSHSSILTGLDPISHGVRSNGTYSLKDEHATLAEILRDEGYETGGFVACFVLNARFGLNQGFDVYNDEVEAAPDAMVGGLTSERDAEQVSNAAVSWLQQRDKKKPFFMWAHFYDPHEPHELPAAYVSRFKDHVYDGEIAFVDAQIGRILDTLTSQGVNQQTIVIVTSDHGESQGEHNELTHTRFIYEATQHVPLILWSPSLWDGGVVVDDVVVGVVDIVPTVLDLLGVESEERFDGISLRRSRENPDRVVYIETMANYLDNGWAPLFGMRRHLDKYILAPKQEYYDLERDPHELTNRFGARSKRISASVQTLSEALAKRRESDVDIADMATNVEDLEPEARQKLEALGYLGGDGPVATEGELQDPKDMMIVWQMVQDANKKSRHGQRKEALSQLLEAKVLAPHDHSIDRHLGILYMRLDRLAEAEESLERYLKVRSTNSSIHALIAQIMIKQKRFMEAKERLKTAYELSPENGVVLVAMGDLLAVVGNINKAQAYYEQALKVDPYRMEKATSDRLNKLQQIRNAMGQ